MFTSYVYASESVKNSGEWFCSAPDLKSAVGTSTSVKVTWKSVAGADNYGVYYREYSGSWKRAAATSSTSCTVTGLSADKTYFFTVRCLSVDGKSYLSDYDHTGLIRLAVVRASAVNNRTGIKVKWNKTDGAEGYYLYRKEGSGSYGDPVKLSASAESYTDKSVKNGTNYTYFIKAYSGKAKGGYRSTAIYRLSEISLTSVKNSALGKVTVKWERNTKGSGYLIQYSTSSSFADDKKSIVIKDASSTSTVINCLDQGKTYYVRIRCRKVSGDSNYHSGWSMVKSVRITDGCASGNVIYPNGAGSLKTTGYMLVAHGGSRTGGCSFNSLAAYKKAGSEGFWGIECDLKVYRNALVTAHDDPDSRSCKFSDYLNVCKKYGCVAVIDVKYMDNYSTDLKKAIDMVRQKGLMDQAVFQSVSTSYIDVIRKYAPDAHIWYLAMTSSMAKNAISYAKTYRIEGVDIEMGVSGVSNYIRQYREAGLHVAANTFLDSRDIKKYAGYGVEYSLCNKPMT